MAIDKYSRRGVLGGALALTTARRALGQAAEPLTANALIERIRKNVGVAWRAQTVDNIVLGDGASPVKGVATTMMATFEVVKRCVAAGMNLIVSHETPVYMHQDDVKQVANDAAYLAKKEFVEKNRAVVFHFHDHWHARKPDGIATGMTRELAWEKNVDPANLRRFTFPGTPLAQLAKEMQTSLNARTMRVIGDPRLRVNKVAASWGYMSSVAMASKLDFDVLVVGETHKGASKSMRKLHINRKVWNVLPMAFSVAFLALAQVSTEVPPPVPGARPVAAERIKVHGAALEGNLEGDSVDRDVIVFLPPSYAAQKAHRYPVVYALHGYSIGAEQWTKEIHAPQTIEGAFAQGAQEMIVVLPDSKRCITDPCTPVP